MRSQASWVSGAHSANSQKGTGPAQAGPIPPMNFEPPSMAKVFAELMAERLHEKQLQYGALAERFPHKVHALDNVLARLDEYVMTGNTAHLVDAANFIAIEFEYPSHPASHLQPLGPDETPEQLLREDGSSN